MMVKDVGKIPGMHLLHLHDATARTALPQCMHVLGQTLKGIHTQCWP
jgi:hypothetical protein